VNVVDTDAAWMDTLTDADDRAWLIGAFVYLASNGALSGTGINIGTSQDRAAADVLSAAGVLTPAGDGFAVPPALAGETGAGLSSRVSGALSSLRQLAAALGIIDDDGQGWGAHDDDTLIAQGQASALGGTMLAMAAVPSLDGLDERFTSGGAFLDVGVGIGAMTAAFCTARPTATAVGIDVLPRALGLARQTMATAGIEGRVQLREQSVEELADTDRFDLAWLPAPFIPAAIIHTALMRIHDALRTGGWLVVGAGRFADRPLSTAVTKWKTLRANGTPLPAGDARELFASTGYVEFQELFTPPGAPALFAGRKP
jgi:SAM-dependent methyltransferase